MLNPPVVHSLGVGHEDCGKRCLLVRLERLSLGLLGHRC